MSNTGFAPFTTTVDKTNRILREIETELGWPRERRNQSYAAQLGAQLPMLVRGIYYEGWDPSGVPVKMHRDEFLQRIRQEFPYDVPDGMEAVLRTVLRTLRQHITDGEWADIKSAMPKDLATALP